MSNFDLLNTQCDNAILIAEDYCLDKSFDILIRNFQFFEEKLNSFDDQSDKINVIKNRFIKNKEKYYKLLTFVNQFSASLENVNDVFNTYKNIWQTKNTPIEVIYDKLVPVTKWADFNQKNGRLTRFGSTTSSVLDISREITEWVNINFVEEQYGIYNTIKVRLYIKGSVNDTFTFNGSYEEKCSANGHSNSSGKTGVMTVCCTGCGGLGGSRGCNRMGPNGRTCGNMYTYCPAGVDSTNCATGTCKGWGEGTDPSKWSFKELNVSGTLVYADTYLLGHDILTLEMINNRWRVIDL